VTVLTDARTRKPPTKKRSYQLAFGVDIDSQYKKVYADSIVHKRFKQALPQQSLSLPKKPSVV
jgi:hypothetical protein